MPLDRVGPRLASPRRGSTPTIADVAALAGVSTSTVSKVINGRYGVSGATGRRVQEAVDLLRFAPSMAATSLRGGSTRVVGLFAARLGPWESEVLRGATLAAGAAGYGLLAWVGVGTEGRRTPQSASSMVEGAIVLTDATAPGLENLPVVLVSSRTRATSRRRDGDRVVTLDETALAPVDIGKGAFRCLLSLPPSRSGREE